MSDQALEQVSVEHEGRILTGVDVSEDALRETLSRHAEEPPAPTGGPAPSAPEPNRNNSGQFAKQTRGQRRFDELTREREDQARRATAAEQERDDLRRQLEQARQTRPEPARVEAVPAAAPAVSSAETEPDFERDYESKVGEKFSTYGAAVQAFNRDYYAYQTKQVDIDARVRDSIEADRASRSFAEGYQRTQAEARKVYADFDAVMDTGPGASIDLGRTPEQANARVRLIAQLPNSMHVQYAIAQDANLARALATMSDVEFGMALARVAPAATGASTASPVRTVVPPPPPYQPVAGGSTTAVPSSADLAARHGDSDYDKSGYRTTRAKERGVRSRW